MKSGAHVYCMRPFLIWIMFENFLAQLSLALIPKLTDKFILFHEKSFTIFQYKGLKKIIRIKSHVKRIASKIVYSDRFSCNTFFLKKYYSFLSG